MRVKCDLFPWKIIFINSECGASGYFDHVGGGGEGGGRGRGMTLKESPCGIKKSKINHHKGK